MIDDDISKVNNSGDKDPKELFSTNHVEGRTELTGEQVGILARLKIMGARLKNNHEIDIIDELVNNFMKLQISKDRKSRQEYVESMQNTQDDDAKGLLQRLTK